MGCTKRSEQNTVAYVEDCAENMVNFRKSKLFGAPCTFCMEGLPSLDSNMCSLPARDPIFAQSEGGRGGGTFLKPGIPSHLESFSLFHGDKNAAAWMEVREGEN